MIVDTPDSIPGLHPSMGSPLAFFQPSSKAPFWELTCASLIVPCRILPPAPGNAAVPERLEALRYQRIKKPKKSSKGSSKSKKRSGKWWEVPLVFPPCFPHLTRTVGPGSQPWVFSRSTASFSCSWFPFKHWFSIAHKRFSYKNTRKIPVYFPFPVHLFPPGSHCCEGTCACRAFSVTLNLRKHTIMFQHGFGAT